jgi:PAS domain-containing protein
MAQEKGKQAAAATRPDADEIFKNRIAPLVKKHCFECHGPDVQESDVALHKYTRGEQVVADEKTWQTVIQMLRSGAMPPEDQPQPTAAERQQTVRAIESILYAVDCDGPPDPGRVTIRRLNRAEYNNTVRDLLGIDFQPADDFPSDDVGSGFDNIGDVLSLPPLLMEKYLAAAETIVERVIVTDPLAKVATQRRERDELTGEGSATRGRGSWEINSEGFVRGQFELPREGEYVVRAIASATQAGDELAEMELRLDDTPVKVFAVIARRLESRAYEIKVRVPAGKHALAARFVNDFYDPGAADENRRDRNLYVRALEITGPVDVRPEEFPEPHRRLIAATPTAGKTAADAARQCLQPLVTRAFRRTASEDEVNRFAKLVEEAVAAGDTIDQGMQVAPTGGLVSPHFLFRVERDPQPDDPAAVHELADYELASRLSYFLWSSMPDEELFAAAAAGKLRDAQTLEEQVRRLLKDPKADSLVHNFAMQWLNLRLLDGITPDPKLYGEFSDDLKRDMRRETELFCQAIIREDRSVLDFLDGDFTFVNARLARHYGIPDVSGDEFRRVSLGGTRRAGVLTQASILTLTSNPGRTSPVKRGKWILENILGAPPPDPPPDVPDLEATQKSSPNASLRQQLEIHRQDAVCASCHKTMDALGFGLEHYDAIGRWRDQDGQLAVDASGSLPGGAKFSGALELAQVLKRRKREFGRCLTEKMLVYALGRPLAPYDKCAIDGIVDKLEEGNYRFSALVVEIATSDPFRKRRGEGDKP